MSSLPSFGALAISRPSLSMQQRLHIIFYTLHSADAMAYKGITDFDGSCSIVMPWHFMPRTCPVTASGQI